MTIPGHRAELQKELHWLLNPDLLYMLPARYTVQVHGLMPLPQRRRLSVWVNMVYIPVVTAAYSLMRTTMKRFLHDCTPKMQVILTWKLPMEEMVTVAGVEIF